MTRQGFPPTDQVSQKRPAWKPYLYKGKQQIEFTIQEAIDCVMYDNPAKPDTYNVYGRIMCKAELEGLPEVTVFMSPLNEVSFF